jgi:tetratricopeptide (TPR) repeat protein
MRKILVMVMLLTLAPATVRAEDEAWDLIGKGQRQVQYGRLKQALDLFKKALKLDPRNESAMNASAQVASFLQLADESVFYYTGYLYLGADYMGDADEVRKAMDKQIRAMKGQKATLHIKALPEDAEIIVNDLPLGKGSVELPVSPEKTYIVKIDYEDYHPYKQGFKLDAGAEKTVTARLKKIIYKGKVKIKVLPSDNVRVFMDTKFMGTSVMEVEGVEGKHLMCFEKDGFDRWWRYVTVPRNESVEIEATLRSESRPREPCNVMPDFD